MVKSNLYKYLFFLHILLFVYSFNGLCVKVAAQYPFLSLGYCFFFGLAIGLLALLALGWQQVLKHMSLVTAYANRPIVIIWSVLWAVVFLGEYDALRPLPLVGLLLIVSGVYLVVTCRE
ncbi:MAG: hypothetical protein PHX74_11115 [Candidatus Sumerlaeales bacterium]|nr:hypothetical protein [Candidatus Sumerlaeales bacterium]